MTRTRWWLPRRDRGSFAVEIAVLAPVLVAMLWVTLSAGRVTQTSSRVQTAARDAARAASINHNGNAMGAAETAMQSSLKQNGVTCTGAPQLTQVDVDLAPGGHVTLRVSCDVSILFGAGTKTVSREATSPLDTYRGTD